MKSNIIKLIASTVLLCLSTSFILAQDTIVKKNGQVIISKVTEISPTEIKYKDWNNSEGPSYVIYREDVRKIKYENGKEEIIMPDLYSTNQEAQIINKTQAAKIGFFAPLNNHIELGYERMIKMTTNLETKIGIIYPFIKEISNDNNVRGGYLRFGLKYLLGQDYYIKGMRFAHPLKGSYVKTEIIYSYFKMYDTYVGHVNQQNPQYGYLTSTSIQGDVAYNAGAINLIYGRQFILGNLLTLDLYGGLGYGITGDKITDYDKNLGPVDFYNFSDPANCFAYLYMGEEFPLTVTGGIALGYIFGSGKDKKNNKEIK
ncbi:MAG: hypothetical protein WC868_12915 [Bacteroidales bacterium]